MIAIASCDDRFSACGRQRQRVLEAQSSRTGHNGDAAPLCWHVGCRPIRHETFSPGAKRASSPPPHLEIRPLQSNVECPELFA
jgi:hypothetical protein